MQDIDEINRELAAVIDALNAVADDDFGSRHALRTRQDELRRLAARFRVDADEQRSTDDLRSELDSRVSQLDAMYEAGIDMVAQAGGGSQTGGSFTSAGEGGLNAKGREAAGGTEVKARIARLRQILAERDG